MVWAVVKTILLGASPDIWYLVVHQQNVKASPGPPKRVMVPQVVLVHPDPPWSTFSVKFEKVWIRMHRSGPGRPRGPRPPLVDQERSGPLWTTLRHFPDANTWWTRGGFSHFADVALKLSRKVWISLVEVGAIRPSSI